MKKNCKECGKEFEADLKRIYCSVECSKIVINRKQRTATALIKRKADKTGSPDEQVISFYLYRYKKGAERRRIGFYLSKEEFASFWQKDCYYCGVRIKTIGIDRRDSSGSYEIENTLPCCSQCNTMKWDMNTQDFINKCIKITNKHERR